MQRAVELLERPRTRQHVGHLGQRGRRADDGHAGQAHAVMVRRGDLGGHRGRDHGPGRARAGERVPLRVGDVDAGERAQLAELLDALGADGGAGGRREVGERLQQRELRRVLVDAGDERAVDLDDVRAHADELLEAGVARAGVVERDPRAAGPQRGQRELERAVLVEGLVLGQLDHDPVEVARERVVDLGREQPGGRDVEREERPGGPVGDGERGAHRARLEHGAQPAAVRLREPQVRRAVPRRGEAGQRLKAGDAAGGDLHHRLEDRDDRRGGRQHRLDLAPLLDQRQRHHVARVVDADAIAARALRPVQRAVRRLEQLRHRRRVGREGGHAGRAGERRAGDREPGERGAAALRDRGRRLRVGPRDEDRELLAADARDEAGLADRPRQRRRRRLQDAIALRVPEGVVEHLEVVEVEHDDADLGADGDGRGEPLLEGAVVAQPGQRVRGRERLEVGALAREPPQGEPEAQHDRQQREPDQGDGEHVELDERLVTDERERGHGERDRQHHARVRHAAHARLRAPGRDGERDRPGGVAEVAEPRPGSSRPPSARARRRCR